TTLNIPGVTNGPIGVVITTPTGPVVGSIDISTKSQFGGAEVNLDRNLCHGDCWNVDFLFGFRFLDLEENLNVVSQSTAVNRSLLFGGVGLPVGSTVGVADRFFTRNQFYGGQLGARAEWWRGPFFVSALGKVALGPNHESVTIAGVTTATPPGGPTSSLP